MTAAAAELTPTEAAVGCVDLVTIRPHPDEPGRWVIRRIHTSRHHPGCTSTTITAASIELAVRWVCRSYGTGRCSAYQTSAVAAHVLVGAP